MLILVINSTGKFLEYALIKIVFEMWNQGMSHLTTFFIFRKIDNDERLDSIDLIHQDAQDKYFDEDEIDSN